MNFDDRLRNHLTAQSNELDVTAEGGDAIRTRSRHRKQRRAGATVMATLLVVALAGGWFVNNSNDDTANVATEGDPNEVEDAAGTAAADEASTTSQPVPITRALPEAGSSLVLTPADNDDAPGGYNVFQSGRSNGLYYVLSTAPGVTYDDLEDGFLRNDTIYTFNGSDWTQSTTGDRFVSTIDSSVSGLLYTVSTGSSNNQTLELGTSTNAGQDWSWTELELTSVFGPDPTTWPPYAVQFATRGNETFVLVHTNRQPDWDEAIALASANGAPVDPATTEVMNVDRDGISWIERPEVSVCEASFSEALNTAWENEPEGPEFDFARELTAAEQAELDAYWAAQEERGRLIYSDALQSVARVPGCQTFVKCMTEYGDLTSDHSLEVDRFYAANSTEDEGLRDEDAAALDDMYAAFENEIHEWAVTSGCDAEISYIGEGLEFDDNESSGYASWESLGVTLPDSWNAVNAGFIVQGAQVTDLGQLFAGENGFLAEVAVTDGDWSITFDTTTYAEGSDSLSTFSVWTSPSGSEWTMTTTDSFSFSRPTSLPNGTTFSLDWSDASTKLIRVMPDGQTGSLTLGDLAPDLDTAGYSIMNAKTGEYGVVAWAVKWNDGSGPAYDSIVLYSPDGVGWGATSVGDVEVVDVIVGDEEVVMFLNDPDREEGTAQPILVGRA